MFRKTLVTAALLIVASFAAPAATAQDGQTWKLGVLLTGLGGGDRGCIVNQVFDNSPASEIGLEPGDVLLTVNGQLASDPNGVRNTVFANDSVTLVLKRGNGYFQKDVSFTNVTPDQGNNNGYGGEAVPVMAPQKKVSVVKTYAVQAPKLPAGKVNTAPKPQTPYSTKPKPGK